MRLPGSLAAQPAKDSCQRLELHLTLYPSISPATCSDDLEVICGVSIETGVVIFAGWLVGKRAECRCDQGGHSAQGREREAISSNPSLIQSLQSGC
jgi:hypothetical protein